VILALVGATLYPISGPPIEAGTVLVEDGRIVAVGAMGEVPVPPDATRVALEGKVLMPGLVDTHSHIGGGRLNDHLSAVQPGLSAADAIDPSHASVQRAQAGGLTTVNIMPGSGKLMGGQTAYVKLKDTALIEDMLLCRSAEGVLAGAEDETPQRWTICGGMKMANGTNAQGKGKNPASRMGAAYLQRKALAKGQARLDVLEERAAAAERPRKKSKPPEAPKPDLEAEALAQVVAGQRTVHFHTHRADDIVTVLRLQEEFGFELVLQHVSEAWKVADEIAAARRGGAMVSASLVVVDSPGGKEEALEIRAENGAVLEELAVPVAWHTDDPITDSRLFLRSAGLAVRAGMSPEGALRALTLTPAEMMGLDERIGSLEVGKDADFVVLSGDPLSTWTHVEQTWVEGIRVFDRTDPADAIMAVGGEEAAVRGEELP